MGAKPTATPVPAPTIDPQQILNQAVKVDSTNNTITVTLTEAQLDALILNEIPKLQASSNISILNPDVKLQDGLVTLSGQIVSGPINVDFKISVKPSVTSNNQVNFTVVESNFGALPIPAQILNQIVEQLNQTVNQSISSSGDNIVVDSITITDGKIIIQAHR